MVEITDQDDVSPSVSSGAGFDTAESSKIPPEERLPVAPWWHTAVVVGLIAGVSVSGLMHRRPGAGADHRLRTYSATILSEWALAAFAYWGIRLRGVPVRRLLGHWPLDMQGWKRDVVAAFSTWMLFVPVLFVIGGTLSHFEKPGVNGSAEQRLAQEGKTRARGSTAKAIDSAGTQQAQSKLSLRLPSPHAARKAIVKLAPQSVGEMLLWILLSISAGICEELVFRGYLQQQFTSVRVAKGGLWVGVALSAVIFGSAHAYEGVVGIISITAFGAVLSLLAIRRSNLRAGMMMHAWHDIFAGMVLFLLKHAHAI